MSDSERESQTARWVQSMFAGIAPRYDLLNHLLSFNIDRGWRKALLKSLGAELADPNARVLDLCCGTGDVLFALQQGAKAQVLGADFCHPMLLGAQRKGHGRAQLIEADALALPFVNHSLEAVAISFGFRNLANYPAGLNELARVLKPRGVLAILEFSHPRRFLTRTAYNVYSRTLLPLIGGAISGSREAYTYLPASIQRFPRAEKLRQMMEEAGFHGAEFQLLSGGIAALHTGRNQINGQPPPPRGPQSLD